MVMQYARSIVAVVIASLCVSLLPYVNTQAVGSQVSPFDFQLDESAVDGKRYSYVIEGGSPAAIIKQNETKSLPVIILPATDKPVPVEFHLSVGYNQTGPIQMPLGVHAIVEPSEITVKPHQNETINIVVSVDKNAPSGKYQLNIVGEWPGPNGFLGSSIIINVGRDYGPDVMPFNALWTPLKLYQSGVAIKDIQCNQDLQLIIKSEDDSPACVKPDTAQALMERGWAKAISNSVKGTPMLSNSTIITNPKEEIQQGTTTVGNQTFYFATLNDTLSSYHGVAAIPITFHNIDFTLFPSVFSGGPPGSCGDTNFGSEVKFSDGTYEKLGVQIPGSSCTENYTETKLTNHKNPQAGLEDYYGKIRLLVSEDNQTSYMLRLFLSTDSTYANPAEAVGVDISLNNTSSTSLVLTKAYDWPRSDLSSGSCSSLPFGIAILKGYYTEQNITAANSLVIYPNLPCPAPPSIKSYTFEPLSSKATQECDSLFSCPELADMKIHLKIDGFMDNNGQHRPFNVGTYTIVGGDEWGDIAIQHFTEAYATPLVGVKGN